MIITSIMEKRNDRWIVLDAIKSLRPGCGYSVHKLNDYKYENIIWDADNSQSKPSESDLNAEIARLKAISDAADYQRKRSNEYPSVGDQLDDLYHKGAFSTEMTSLIKETKDKYPKS